MVKCLPEWCFDSKAWKALPSSLKQLVHNHHKLFPKGKQKKRSLHSVEVFAGKHQLTKAVKDKQLCASFFDILTNPDAHNIESTTGLHNIIQDVFKLQKGGTIWGGPPCKSWVFIGRCGTERTKQNAAGNPANHRVAKANLQTSHFVLCCTLAHLRGCHFIIENPGSTLMWNYGPIKDLSERGSASNARTYMVFRL